MNDNEKDCIRSAQRGRPVTRESSCEHFGYNSLNSAALWDLNRNTLLVSTAGDGFALSLERWHGCAADEFDGRFGVRARRFPCNFASRAATREKWSRGPLHEVSHRISALGIGERARAAAACGRIISTGRILPSLHSGQRSGGFGCGCLVTAAS
jgi:hypothetical protein